MPTTYKQLVDEVTLVVSGYGLSNPRASHLTAPVSDTDLQFSVISAANMDQGIAEIEGELVFIDSVDRDNNVLTIAPDGRGHLGTTAAAHDANVRVDFNPPWPRTRIKQIVNQTIISTYPTLFGVGTASFTFVPSVTTYEMPAEAEKVLSVTADTLGPSREQQRVNRYAFNSVAPTDDFASGNSLTLQEGVAPGRTVTVTYLKQPSELVNDSDLLTASGLRESARKAIVLGTCAELLAFLDLARLPTDTAQADEYDNRNSVGTATKISNSLYQRFQIELEQERRRLRETTPVSIKVRTR